MAGALIFSLLLVSTLFPQNVAIPSSSRSKQAVERCTPILLEQFKNNNLEFGNKVFIRIFKQSDELELWIMEDSTFRLFKTYSICDFSGGIGPKKRQGDGKSPEGFYFVKPSQLNPWSRFHLSFNLGYPNAYDRSHGYTGSALMVHGDCVSIGCYAITDVNIEEIWTIINKAFENGQPFFRIHIFPFRMTPENIDRFRGNKNFDFWINLQEGFSAFEQDKIPPNVEVLNKRYIFN